MVSNLFKHVLSILFMFFMLADYSRVYVVDYDLVFVDYLDHVIVVCCDTCYGCACGDHGDMLV